jgi:hypothetical protein
VPETLTAERAAIIEQIDRILAAASATLKEAGLKARGPRRRKPKAEPDPEPDTC